MCTATTSLAAAAGLQVGSALLGHRTQSKAAALQQQQINEGMGLALSDLSERQSQGAQDTAEAMSDRSLQGLRDLALVNTTIGEYGGSSRLAVDTSAATGRDLATMEANQRRAFADNRRDAFAIVRGGQSKIASIQRPSALGTALTIGSAAANAYASYSIANSKKGS